MFHIFLIAAHIHPDLVSGSLPPTCRLVTCLSSYVRKNIQCSVSSWAIFAYFRLFFCFIFHYHFTIPFIRLFSTSTISLGIEIFILSSLLLMYCLYFSILVKSMYISRSSLLLEFFLLHNLPSCCSDMQLV